MQKKILIRLEISKQEINSRKLNWIAPNLKVKSGSLFKYAKCVSSASLVVSPINFK